MDETPEGKALIDDVVERTPNKYACYNYDTDEEAIRQVSVIQGLSCAGTFGLAFGPVGLLAGAGMGLAMGYLCSDNRAEAEKEKILRERVIKVFAEIQNGTIDFHDQREILPYFCQSPKLANLKPETFKNIIQNIRVDKHIYYQKNVRRKSNIVNAYDKYTSQYSATSVLASLINNVHLDELLPKYYDIIDNKIDTLQDTHENREILKNKLYILKKGNKAFDKKGLDLKTDFFELRKEVSKNKKDISEVKKDISKLNISIESLKENLDNVVKKQNYSSDEIKVLKDLIGVMEDKIDAIENPQERLTELESFQKILKPLAEIAKEPEFINALKALHKGYKIDVDFNRQLKVLKKILSEKLPNNEVAQEKIEKFAKGYQGALSQLYELAPGFSSSVLSTNVGKKSTMIKMLSSALNTACGEVPIAKTGAALIANELNKMAANQSSHIINDIRVLGEVADGQTEPDNRADKDKKNVALQVINQHVLHMATHLCEDPKKLDQLEEEHLKSTKKIKEYHGKALESLRGIAEDINIINSGEASAGTVSEILHQRIEKITPIEEVSCRMTAYALTSALPAFIQGENSRTKREATIRAVECRNILRGNTPNNNNNQAYRPYASHHTFGNI